MDAEPPCGTCTDSDPPKFSTRPRRLPAVAEEKYEAIAEPMAAYRDSANDCVLLGCGASRYTQRANGLRVETLKREASGDFLLNESRTLALPSGCDDGSCLPWIRVARDPQKFRQWYRWAEKLGPIKTGKKFYHFIKNVLTAEDQETFLVVCLNTQLLVLGISEIARGARDHVETPVNDIMRLTLMDGASTFIVAHNHPSGRMHPSKSDEELTKIIAEAGEVVGIPLMDHVVVGANDFYSFAAHKKI